MNDSSKGLLLLLIFIFGASYLRSEILNVPDMDYPTIQAGIDSASNGDTVLVAIGTYYENLKIIGKDIILCSQFIFSHDTSDISQTVIDGGYNGSVILIENGVGSTTELVGFTVTKGRSSGIYLRNVNLIIRNTGIKYSENSLGGGGISCRSSILKLYDVYIAHNHATGGNTGTLGYGGGLSIIQGSDVRIENSMIRLNQARENGGGIHIRDSEVYIKEVNINSNSTRIYNGGGIYISGDTTNVHLDHVKIYDNIARDYGGGLYAGEGEYNLTFSNVSIYRNRVIRYMGGGFYSDSPSKLIFSSENLSSIYFNKSQIGGADIAIPADSSTFIASLDTFSVSDPGEFHLSPRNNINLTFQNVLFNSVDADLYVSPNGSDTNSGISPANALRSINTAMLSASTDSTKQRYIHVAPGTYSPSSTGEDFPLYGRNHVTVIGNNAEETIIDGEGKEQVIHLYDIHDYALKNFTIQNGYSDGSAGIYADMVGDIEFENLIVRRNRGKYLGGAISVLWSNYCRMKNVLVYDNEADDTADRSYGIYLWFVQADLINVTIANNKKGLLTDTDRATALMVTSARVSLINSIIYNNDGNSIKSVPTWGNPTTLNVGWSNIEGGIDSLAIDSTVSFNWLDGNINKDPLFVGGEPYSYYLKPESPCIDAGTALYEFEGDTIVNYSPEEYEGLAPDMGAFGINLVDFVEEKDLIPNQFQLYQNYPNPFNNSTTISYQLVKPGNVNLSIYDITGQLVQVLENGKKLANTYRIIWDASRLSSGIYFMRLSTENQTAVRKMLLVK